MVLSLGKLPEHLWLKWTERTQYFDESLKWVADPKSLPGFCSSRMKEQEKIPFEFMIRKMVSNEPRERATVAEFVKLIPDTWLWETWAQKSPHRFGSYYQT